MKIVALIMVLPSIITLLFTLFKYLQVKCDFYPNVKFKFDIKCLFVPQDIWIGLYWDRKKKWLYIFTIPTVGIVIKIDPFRTWLEELKQIAFNWDNRQYPLNSSWVEEFWRNGYYNCGMTPQQTWNDYTAYRR